MTPLHPTEIPEEISPEEVTQALNRALAGASLVQSAQLRRLLRHLVEKCLAGESGALKESLLGTDVFDRGNQFDPRKDSVVRVEARRLRSKLDEYYAGEGGGDAVLIRLPRGSYVPTFERRAVVQADVPAVPERSGKWKWRMALAAVVLGAVSVGAVWRARQNAPVAVAVLPFTNLGGDAETAYYADGLTEELIDYLGRTSGIQVVARTSVFQLRRKLDDPVGIGRQLNAAVLVEGSFRKQGSRVRISTQLIDAKTGYEMWSETIQRDWSQVMSVQREVGAAVASRLKGRAPAVRPSQYPGNAEAWDLYLKGRFHWNKRTAADINRAIAEFRQAIALDPNYAPAWAGLADSWSMLGFMEDRAPADLRRQAAEAAQRSVQLDSELPEAHVAMATVQALYDWDWTGAERSYRRALELDPNSALAYYGLSKVLATRGRLDEAIVAGRRATVIDPLVLIMASSLGWELAAARRYTEAGKAFQTAVELDPAFVWTYLFRAWSYEVRNDYSRAMTELSHAVALPGRAQ